MKCIIQNRKQANLFWQEIPKHFLLIELGEFVIMPNHVHGIIGITAAAVRTRHGMSLHGTSQRQTKQNQFGKTIAGSLSAIIGQYKSTLSRWCNKNNFSIFAWHPKFNDRIIRNQDEYLRIENYIIANIQNWNKDRFKK